jgi:hypothetical protein
MVVLTIMRIPLTAGCSSIPNGANTLTASGIATML